MDEKMNDEEFQDDIELTGEDNVSEPELENIEAKSKQKIKTLQDKLKACEQDKAKHLEDLQRAKADFLNSKSRLQEEKERDKVRVENKQILKLLPLCDSFHMAMHNKAAWEEISAEWRKGIESIHNQLHAILDSYNVTEFNPEGDDFDPNKHEAMSTVPVTEKKLHHTVITVMQNGFIRTVDGKEELVRPARVTIGEFEE